MDIVTNSGDELDWTDTEAAEEAVKEHMGWWVGYVDEWLTNLVLACRSADYERRTK